MPILYDERRPILTHALRYGGGVETSLSAAFGVVVFGLTVVVVSYKWCNIDHEFLIGSLDTTAHPLSRGSRDVLLSCLRYFASVFLPSIPHLLSVDRHLCLYESM